MTRRVLTARQFSFFQGISEAVLLNPFTEERKKLDEHLSGKRRSKSATWESIVSDLLKELKTQLAELSTADIGQTTTEERRVLERALLFQLFHEFSDEFDVLIRSKKRRGPLDIAEEIQSRLSAFGVKPKKAQRYIAVMFQLRRAFVHLSQIAGSSPSMQALRARLWSNIFTNDIELFESALWDRMEDFSVMIVGETGSGKGMAAKAIGLSGFIPFDANSGRFDEDFSEQFVEINLSQFPESLIESELFGHQKGAFTGAISEHKGVFERCPEHGTIFLDELGETSQPVQIKLLRVLQERAFSPVGSHEAKKFVGRVIAATNRDVHRLRSEGTFRDDFYYRLCSDVIEMPPLRIRLQESPEELDELLQSIVLRIMGDTNDRLVERVKGVIENDLPKGYAWPGNVRELEQCVRRVITRGTYSGDPVAHREQNDVVSSLASAMDAGSIDARTLLTRYCQLLYDRHGTYEEVAKRTRLDRRTVKKYIVSE